MHHQDLPGGTRVDEEGMVYCLDGGARTVYFCDRFRRYKFDVRNRIVIFD